MASWDKTQREMKRKLEQKRDSFHIEMNLGNGIQKIKDLNYGIYLTEKKD